MLFWKEEVLKGGLMALDRSRKKVLYCNHINNKPACLMIDLKDVNSCTIKKQYNGIHAGALLQHKLQDYLKSILLYFHFKNNAPAIALPFYEENANTKEEAVCMEIKAKEWKTIISQLLTRQIAERA